MSSNIRTAEEMREEAERLLQEDSKKMRALGPQRGICHLINPSQKSDEQIVRECLEREDGAEGRQILRYGVTAIDLIVDMFAGTLAPLMREGWSVELSCCMSDVRLYVRLTEDIETLRNRATDEGTVSSELHKHIERLEVRRNELQKKIERSS